MPAPRKYVYEKEMAGDSFTKLAEKMKTVGAISVELDNLDGLVKLDYPMYRLARAYYVLGAIYVSFGLRRLEGGNPNSITSGETLFIRKTGNRGFEYLASGVIPTEKGEYIEIEKENFHKIPEYNRDLIIGMMDILIQYGQQVYLPVPNDILT